MILGANLIFNQTVPFERARFTCTPGAALSSTSFMCTIPQEVNATRWHRACGSTPAVRVDAGRTLLRPGSPIRHVAVTSTPMNAG